jgi:hypothetical protein
MQQKRHVLPIPVCITTKTTKTTTVKKVATENRTCHFDRTVRGHAESLMWDTPFKVGRDKAHASQHANRCQNVAISNCSPFINNTFAENPQKLVKAVFNTNNTGKTSKTGRFWLIL